MRSLVIAIAAALAFTGAAHADPLDIIRVPTAEVRPQGTFHFGANQEWAVGDSERADDSVTTLRSNWSILPRVEIGLDVEDAGEDGRLRGDVKFQAIDPGAAPFGLAVGAYGLGASDDATLYGVATTRTGQAALTGGLGWRDDRLGLLLGAELEPGARWRLFGEYLSIDDDEARLGAGYEVIPGVDAALYYGREDSGRTDVVGLEVTLVTRIGAAGGRTGRS